MEYDALHLVFYVVIGLTGLVIAFALLKIAFRNLPLWLFELWPYVVGLLLAAVAFLKGGWVWAVVAAGLGFAMGLAWSGLLEHAKRRGREHSGLERMHYALIRWAQK